MRMRWMASVLLALGALRADTIVLRDGKSTREKQDVTVTEDGLEEVKYLDRGGQVQAKESADKVVRIAYDKLPPEAAEAESAFARGDLAAAAAAFSGAAAKCERAAPKVHCLFRAAESLYALGKLSDARAAYGRCRDAAAGSRLGALAEVRAARCDFHAGKPDEARKALEAVKAPRGTEPDCERDYWIGRILARKEDVQAARLRFQDAARKAGDRFEAIHQAADLRDAWVAARKDPPDRAVSQLEALRKGDGASGGIARVSGEYFALLAREQLRLGLDPQAKEEARLDALSLALFSALRVIDVFPDDPEALADAHRAAKEALEAMQAARPDEGVRKEIQRQIQELERQAKDRFGGGEWLRQ